MKTLGPRLRTADTRRVRPAEKLPDPFYNSPEWRRLLNRLVAERGRACERCGRSHDDTGQPIRIFGDHVRELADDGAALDASNVMLLCGSCHTRKTANERANRRRGGAH